MWCIVRRECRDLLRRPRSLWQLGLGLLLFAFVFTVVWGAMTDYPGGRPPDMGRKIFSASATLQLIFLLGLGRVSSYGIAGEHEKDTWDLLVASPIRPWSIVLGKLVASLLYMGLVYFALLPMLALCLILGGLSPRELFGTYLILGGGALLAASVGLFVSSSMRSSISAARTTTLILIFYSTFLPLIQPVVLDIFFNSPMNIFPAETLLSPFYALFKVLASGPGVSGPWWFVAHPEWTFFCFAVAVSTALLMHVAHRIGSFESHPALAVRKSSGKSRSIALREWHGIADTANPIWARETREQNARRFFKPKVVYVSLLFLGILLGAMMKHLAGSPPGRQEIFGISSAFTLIGILFFVPAGPAGAIARERGRKTWDVLRTSACTSRNIIMGKTHAELKYALCCTVSFFLGLYGSLRMERIVAGKALFESGYGLQLVCTVLLLGSCIVFYISTGVYFSSRTKDSARAHAQTFGIVLIHCLGPFILSAISNLPIRPYRYGWLLRDFADTIQRSSPFVLLVRDGVSQRIGDPDWMVRVITHSVFIVLLGVLFVFAAQRRIDRYEE